ncbi:TRAP dicarboxylate transporter, DctP subunit [Desulfitobacterium hafniense DCB-2]|uniref:TRAP dicarboxylate transporter, DctP subunit n=1 Tax=Desulfitobacterium hafniense (strain DSM 10664 / DCB-2) TaxID=272564 RepID=B8FZQ2_DESHD|nr:DctP family TRAP transporter solute-binding subunit [Desulfitobacterium hafniense]ACL19126.1 TRAP dicarboxylate transporter, DctP subunit [Desulfitobacterium hafniense DCB-2]
MSTKIYAIILGCLLLWITGCQRNVIDQQQVTKDERIVIKFSHVVAENSPKGLAAERFASLVRRRTGGYVEVQVYPNSELYKDGEEFDALKNGAIEMIAPATSKLSAMIPEWQLFDLPYAFNNLENIPYFVDGPVGQMLLARLEEHSMLGLAVWHNGFKQMTNSSHPLQRPEDYRGLEFRIMPFSNTLKYQFEVLGAVAHPLAFSDVHAALETGGVDGEENTISNIFTQRFDQVQKYLTISDHGYLGYIVIVNKEFWEGLPEGIRKILEEALAEVTLWEREKAAEVNAQQLAALEREGEIKIHYLNAEEQKALEEALAPVYEMLAEDIGTELVDLMRNS